MAETAMNESIHSICYYPDAAIDFRAAFLEHDRP
jgi:hypothetical protein